MPPSVTSQTTSVPFSTSTAISADVAVVDEQPVAGPDVVGQLLVGRRDAVVGALDVLDGDAHPLAGGPHRPARRRSGRGGSWGPAGRRARRRCGPAASAAWRTSWKRRPWSACSPWLKLSRATSMPASTSARARSGVSVAGPSVQTIFARRITSSSVGPRRRRPPVARYTGTRVQGPPRPRIRPGRVRASTQRGAEISRCRLMAQPHVSAETDLWQIAGDRARRTACADWSGCGPGGRRVAVTGSSHDAGRRLPPVAVDDVIGPSRAAVPRAQAPWSRQDGCRRTLGCHRAGLGRLEFVRGRSVRAASVDAGTRRPDSAARRHARRDRGRPTRRAGRQPEAHLARRLVSDVPSRRTRPDRGR